LDQSVKEEGEGKGEQFPPRFLNRTGGGQEKRETAESCEEKRGGTRKNTTYPEQGDKEVGQGLTGKPMNQINEAHVSPVWFSSSQTNSKKNICNSQNFCDEKEIFAKKMGGELQLSIQRGKILKREK